jgi:hypothetical protein
MRISLDQLESRRSNPTADVDYQRVLLQRFPIEAYQQNLVNIVDANREMANDYQSGLCQ